MWKSFINNISDELILPILGRMSSKKHPHVNLKWGAHDISTNENSKILKTHGLMAFRVNMLLVF